MTVAEPGRYSVPCRNNAHARCQLADCLCECHDEPAPDEPPDPGVPRPTGTRKGEKKHLPEIDLAWESPPSQFRRRSPYVLMEPLIEELRSHPDEWARLAVYKGPSSAATSIVKMRAMYPGIEFTARRRDDGGSALYGRCPEST